MNNLTKYSYIFYFFIKKKKRSLFLNSWTLVYFNFWKLKKKNFKISFSNIYNICKRKSIGDLVPSTLKMMRTAAGFTTRPDSHSFSAHSFHGTFHGINSPWATAIFQPFYTSPRNVFAFQLGLWIRGRVFKGGRWILIPAFSRKSDLFLHFRSSPRVFELVIL